MKRKNILFLLLLFFLFNGSIYIITQINNKERIKLVLNNNMKTLQIHYEILLHTQKITASTMYQSTIESDRLLEIISQANHETEEKKNELRVELQKLLESKYHRGKQKGVLQYQFVLVNNESFLRMHKPSKFGDNLTNIRDDFAYVNRTKEPIRGFTQGRTAHGFRNTFPIFDKNKRHIGAMEISFSSDSFQWYLNYVSHVHTHFIVNKKIFNTKTWERDDLTLTYSQSAENRDYMVTLGTLHTKEKCILQNQLTLKPIRKDIDTKILKGRSFSVYAEYENKINVFSFLPIKNLKKKTVAWLVSYEESPFIESTLKYAFIIKMIGLLISILIIYFIIQQIYAKELMGKRNQLLDDILNITNDIMFITNFKDVSFSNNNFKNFLNRKYTQKSGKETYSDIRSIFVHRDGYLHSGLLKENEEPIQLFKRTPEDKRVVIVFDKYFQEKVFKINISKTNNNDDYYLVTMSDITKIKEKQIITEKKAYIDGLTGVYNRNKFDEIVDEEIYRVERYKNKLSMAIIDIDRFKDVNDTYGHLIGDEILIMMAQDINNNIRDTDFFARWGGEEFVILFKETSVKNAKIVSEKLKDKIENLQHPTAGGITASFGVTEYREGETIKSMFERCDKALYLAKENGRNRIEVL